MKKETKELRYEGYFLMDSGLKVYFDISAEKGDENYDTLYGNSEFKWEQGESIYFQDDNGEDAFILADKVIGFFIKEYILG